MSEAPPIPCEWDGEIFVPVPGFRKTADRHFVIGEVYALAPHEDRSGASHRHYFAALHTAWANLPEEQAQRFPTSEHLRKFALVATGFADHRSIVCGSRAEALRVAGFIQPMDTFAVVSVTAAVVNVWTAQSQSMRAMGNERFKASKQAVLDYVAGLIGVASDDLSKGATNA